MKKVLFIITLVLLPMLASAAVEIDGIYYNLDTEKETAEVTSNPNKYQGEVIIPGSFEYGGTSYSVTSIGNSAFWVCSSLTSVTIPDGVTTIGDYAFNNCIGLTSVTIGNGVTSIGSYAFQNCNGLTSVTIPESVTSIGEHTFSICSGLTSITIPSSVTSIGEGAFTYCRGLTSFMVDGSNPYYKSEDGVLMSKNGTTLIAYPISKTETTYIIPDGMTSIGSNAFQECRGLTSITIPGSITSIGEGAFDNCSGLTSITIPDGVTSIGYAAFAWCNRLTSITIPGSVTGIEGAFAYCNGLTSIMVDGSNSNYKSVDGVLMSKDGTTIVAYPIRKNETAYIIPDGVTSIGLATFAHCYGLTSVTIPNSVTSIGESAFASCRSLLEFYCYANNVPKTESNTFSYTNIANTTLHVPAGAVDAYKAAEPWNQFKEIVALEGGGDYDPKFDLNNDGVVNAADVVMLINFIAGKK